MVKQTIYLEKYDWIIDIYLNYDCQYVNEIIEQLESLGISERRLDIAFDDLSSCRPNIGITYSSYIYKKTIIIIGKTTSAKEFEKSLHHEIGHCQTHICQYYYIDPYGEEIHYIGQDIIDKIWDICKKYLCDHVNRI